MWIDYCRIAVILIVNRLFTGDLSNISAGGKCSMQMTKILCDVWNCLLIVTTDFDSQSFHLQWLNLQYALKNDKYHLLKFNSITDHFHDRRVRPRERRSSHPAPETFTNKQISPQRENQTLRRNLMSNLCSQVGCRKSALFNLLESMFL